MNVFFQELKYYRKSVIIWSASLVALLILYVSIFPAFLSAKDAFEKVLARLSTSIVEGYWSC